MADPWQLLLFPLIGAVSGLMAGLFGVGGGLVIVPALNLVFSTFDLGVPADSRMHFSIGSSLAVIAFTALSSAYAHHSRGAVVWAAFRRLIPGIVTGGLIGAMIADALANRTLQATFGAFVIAIAIYVIMGRRPRHGRHLPGNTVTFIAGSVIGGVSALAGIGGGVMTVPFLVWAATPLRHAVGTAAACTLPVAVAGAAGFAIAGWGGPAPSWSTGYILWPAVLGISVASMITAPVGAWFAHTLPVGRLRQAFALLLIVIGLRMLIG